MSSLTSISDIDSEQESEDAFEEAAAAEEQPEQQEEEEEAVGSGFYVKGAVAFGVVLLAGLLVWNSLTDPKEITVVQPAKTSPSQHQKADKSKSRVSSAARVGVYAKAVHAVGRNRAAVGIAAGAALFLVAALVYWQMSEKVVVPVEDVDDPPKKVVDPPNNAVGPINEVVDPPKDVVDHDQEQHFDLEMVSWIVGPVCLLAIIGSIIVYWSSSTGQPSEYPNGDKPVKTGGGPLKAVNQPVKTNNVLLKTVNQPAKTVNQHLPTGSFLLKELDKDGKTFFENSGNVLMLASGKKALQMRAQYLFKLLYYSRLVEPEISENEFTVQHGESASFNFRMSKMSKSPKLFDIVYKLKSLERSYIPVPQTDGSYFEKDQIKVVKNIIEIQDDLKLKQLITDISDILKNKEFISTSYDQSIWNISNAMGKLIDKNEIPSYLQLSIKEIRKNIDEKCKWNEKGEDVEVKVINADSKSDENPETVKLPQGSNIYDLYRKLYSEKPDAKFALIFDKQHLRWSSNQLITGVPIYKKDLSSLLEEGAVIPDKQVTILKLCDFSLGKTEFYLKHTSPNKL